MHEDNAHNLHVCTRVRDKNQVDCTHICFGILVTAIVLHGEGIHVVVDARSNLHAQDVDINGILTKAACLSDTVCQRSWEKVKGRETRGLSARRSMLKDTRELEYSLCSLRGAKVMPGGNMSL